MRVLITLLSGGLCGLLLVGLAAYVSALRTRLKVFVGDTPPPELQRAIRAHGNAAENIPMGILLLLLLELGGLAPTTLYVLGATFLLGRLLHALGMLTGSKLVAVGITINYLALAVMSGWNVYLHFMK